MGSVEVVDVEAELGTELTELEGGEETLGVWADVEDAGFALEFGATG
jgi:hypothetical protein